MQAVGPDIIFTDKTAHLVKYDLPQLRDHAAFFGYIDEFVRRDEGTVVVTDADECFRRCKPLLPGGVDGLIENLHLIVCHRIRDELFDLLLLVHCQGQYVAYLLELVYRQLRIVSSDVFDQGEQVVHAVDDAGIGNVDQVGCHEHICVFSPAFREASADVCHVCGGLFGRFVEQKKLLIRIFKEQRIRHAGKVS